MSAGILWRTYINTQQADFSFSYETTAEPLGTDTSLIHTIPYYGQFPMSWQNSHIFSLKKTSLIQTLSNMDTKSWPQRVNSFKLNLFITGAVVIR